MTTAGRTETLAARGAATGDPTGPTAGGPVHGPGNLAPQTGDQSDRAPQPEAAGEAEVRPGPVCAQLLAAMDASEGRRKRRKRNTTPDAIGMEIKRDLLGAAAAADPDPADFEAWLLERCLAAGPLAGATRAMALAVLDEWRAAAAFGTFRAWLEAGAPSDDTRPGPDMGLDPR